MRSLISKFLFFFLLSASFIHAEMFTRTKVAMGTFVSISLESKYKNYIEDGFNLLGAIELSLSSYNPQAKIYQLNETKNIQLDTYTYEALLLSRKYFYKTDGLFNIAIGKVTKDLYRFGEEQRLPESSMLDESNVDYINLYFSPTQAFLANDIKLDLGGFGKGYGVDKLSEYYKSKGISKAIVALSGDIRCLSECEIEVANPFGDNTLLSFRTAQKEMGVSTSGNYNRYVESKEHNHLINPKLKKPQQSFTSITLISTLSSADLDAYATAASVMAIKKAYSFLDTLDLAYIVIQSDGVMKLSENLDVFTKDLVFNDGMKK